MGKLGVKYLGLSLKSPLIVSSSRLTSTPGYLKEAEDCRAGAQDIKIDISASTGVHSGVDAVRYLLAGAHSVQVCSVLYDKGIPFLKNMTRQIETWMDKKGYQSIAEFRGKLNYRNYPKPVIYERTQFMKYFSSEG
jgi:dihydroorotate dehydrogenase (fumarate)